MSQSSVLGSLLSSVFKRKGLQPDFTADEVARKLCLQFPSVRLTEPSIHWQHSLHLQQLLNLPSNALSGPVQDDKAAAYRYLSQIVGVEHQELPSFDLRALYGLNHEQPSLYPYDTWEAMALAAECRHIRIISIRDFNRILSVALGKTQTVDLLGTSWASDKLYWAGTQHTCELVSALVYARRRELPLHLPARVQRLKINAGAAQELHRHYHTLAMPADVWTDPVFMDYLVNHKVPYVRLSLALGQQKLQTIVLARSNPHSNTFGNGLLHAGASELSELLLQLARA